MQSRKTSAVAVPRLFSKAVFKAEKDSRLLRTPYTAGLSHSVANRTPLKNEQTAFFLSSQAQFPYGITFSPRKKSGDVYSKAVGKDNKVYEFQDYKCPKARCGATISLRVGAGYHLSTCFHSQTLLMTQFSPAQAKAKEKGGSVRDHFDARATMAMSDRDAAFATSNPCMAGMFFRKCFKGKELEL